MTKSRQSAIKLRLSRLIRCLVALGCIKLAIMGVALLDLPMPAWLGGEDGAPAPQTMAEEGAGQEFNGKATTEAVVAEQKAPAVNADEPLPQGAAAAELASAAKPRRQNSNGQTALPAPLVTADHLSPIANEGSAFIAPLLPEPPALDAPLAAAGVIVPEVGKKAAKPAEDSIWNMLDIKSLPIPVLGSVKAAHAAALDMPVPKAPTQQSPFAPAEQLAPITSPTGQPTVLPGAPPLPDNLPRGQNPDGTPLPVRQGGLPANTGMLPPLPAGAPGMQAPAPNIAPQQTLLDHNTKSQELARQQQDILMLRQQMDQRMKDLQTAEDKMKEMLREAKEVEDKKVKSLVQMYANMKPRTAAQALENMDERVAVRILNGMAPKQSGEILTYTNPAKTAKFTEMITRMRMAE